MSSFFRKLLRPWDFLTSGMGSGVLLLLCVFISMTVANTSLGPAFQNLLDSSIGFSNSWLDLEYSVGIWINDGLMAIFFLLVGLEIKRELLSGELSSPQRAALPAFAALGGVIVPATIFKLFNSGLPTAGGWGIPMATDIAFALAIVSMLGKKVPISLKIFLAALAIVDDLMAILVIAIFYSGDLHTDYLMYAGIATAVLVICNKMRVTQTWIYLVVGVLIWYFIHHSGIHATIAGVITAMTIPAFKKNDVSPLESLEHILSKPVNLLIMPLFALANTNIAFVPGMTDGLFEPLGMGIIFGLVIGKPVGIMLFSWLSIRMGLAAMPAKAGWSQMFGVGMLAGIGFTMSIFISVLSFGGKDLMLAEAKFSVLMASTVAAILGAMFCTFIYNRQMRKAI